MSDNSAEKMVPAVLTATAAVLALAAGAVVPLVEPYVGPGLAHLAQLVGLIGCVTFVLAFPRYYGILGRGDVADYDRLRDALAHGGTKYADRLGRVLDRVDRWFGDAGHPGQRAFRMVDAKPLWTAASFDRCLLLALLYPIATIFGFWVWSGQSGSAEAMIGLKAGVGPGHRLLAFVPVAAEVWCMWEVVHAGGDGGSGFGPLLPLALALSLSVSGSLSLSASALAL